MALKILYEKLTWKFDGPWVTSGYVTSDSKVNFCENSTAMWYEMIPPTIIIGLIPVVPQWACYYINQFFLGNPMRRDMRDVWDRNMYTRDCRIDGKPWKNRGLENVPDD